MIVYKLSCKNQHDFDAWFRNSEVCEAQLEAGQVVCPECGSRKVSKALMAPRLAKGAKRREPAVPAQVTNDPQAAARAEFIKAMRQLREHIETNCTYVGERFPEEARKIHYGEAERRDIYGEASPEEARRLKEEGVEVYGIPWLPRHDS